MRGKKLHYYKRVITIYRTRNTELPTNSLHLTSMARKVAEKKKRVK